MKKLVSMGLCVLPFWVLVGCNGSSSSDTANSELSPISISFAAVADGKPVDCSLPITGLGTTKVDANLTDLRFFVSEVNLAKSDGTTVPVELDDIAFHQVNKTGANDLDGHGIALVGLTGAGGGACTSAAYVNSHTTITGKIPAGTQYKGISFSVAIPELANHVEPSLDPYYATTILGNSEASGMTWSWQSGHKFAKIEVTPIAGITKGTATSPTANAIFQVHLGATGCSALDVTKPNQYTCTNVNNAHIAVSSFNAGTQNIVLDLAKLFATTDISKDAGGPVGCMSGKTDPECATILPSLNVGLNDGLSVAAEGPFSAVNK